MNRKIYFFASLLSVVALGSCGKLEMLPAEPSIKFENFSVYDTNDILGNEVRGGQLKFYFEDGDGDIGLHSQAEAGEENYDSINLFVTLYRINNGTSAPAAAGDPYYPTGFRIPYMERVGRNTILRGHISVRFTYFFYTREDSIRYDFYIKDRAGNVSNTISTPVISIFNKGIYGE
ncbi:MAG TPA: hypothetical protein PLX08_00170 [Bacteroidales bacterium]|jgi:hypothetical protein|nr:hypothetical protein [Bacteroidales bacterium]